MADGHHQTFKKVILQAKPKVNLNIIIIILCKYGVGSCSRYKTLPRFISLLYKQSVVSHFVLCPELSCTQCHIRFSMLHTIIVSAFFND
jgi:hypothetical protein